jgi:hypothetical protein
MNKRIIEPLLAASLFVLTALVPAAAQTYNYSVYIDSDNSASTGCSVVFPDGTINGAEVRLQATVNAGTSPSVTTVTRETCSGGTFGAGTVIGGGYPVGLGNGLAGASVVELNDTLAAVQGGNTGAMRLYVVARSDIGDDVLLSTNGALNGPPILFTPGAIQPSAPAQPIPTFGIPALLLLIGLVVFIGSRAARRRMRRFAAMLMFISGIAWAGTFISDGQVGDWIGYSPIATDPAGDSTSGQAAIDLRAFFAATQTGNIFFRIDVANVNALSPPITVNDSYTASSGVALNIAAPGVLSNDTLNSATISAHTSPAHGALSLNADGSFAYTPTAGYTGSDSFSYTLTNSGGTSTATVTFTVVAGPVAVADSYATSVGTGLNISASGVLSNDQLGAPPATMSSYGGGSLGGSVTDNTPGVAASGTLGGTVLTLNADGSFVLGAPPMAGSYTFLYRIGNSQGTSDGIVTVQVNEAPTITSANTTTFNVGSVSSFSITSTGTPNATISESGTLPSGVIFTPGSGGGATLSGTAATGTSGSYPLILTATNGVGSPVTQNFTLIITEGPAITSAITTTFTVGTSGSFTVTDSGAPTPTLSQSGALPSGVTFTAATGVLSGTPAAGTGGSHPMIFTATNGIGSPATQNFTLVVDQAPAITSAATTTFTVGSAGTFSITTTGNPNSAISESGALPSGVTVLDGGSGTAILSGTPAAGTGGSYPITITANNGIGTAATQSFTLLVDQAPTITSANATAFVVGASGSFTVTAGGVPSPTLSETGALPSGVTFVPGTGVLAGTAAAGTAGSYPITFTATNGIGIPVTQTFTLQVNEAPAISSANTTTFTVGSVGSFNITSTATPNATLTESGALPSGVVFTPGSGGTATLSGTPVAGTSGSYPLTLTATNGIGSPATQNFTLVITQGAAIISANSTTFTVGIAGTFSVTGSGAPAPTLSESGTLPSGVTFVAASGILSGTPAAGTGGSYPIMFTATNGVGSPATQNFTLIIDQAPAITSAATTTFTVGTAGTFIVTTTGNPNAAISKTGTLPGGVALTDNGNGTATLSGTPAAATGGSYPITISANNGVGSAATQNFTLVINQAPAITSASTTTFIVGVSGSFTVTASGTPASTFSEIGALPAGVTLNASTGVLAGTPAAGNGGSYAITLTAANGVTPNATQSFTLIVDQAPAITSATTTTFVVGTAGSFTITTTGYPNAVTSETGSLPSGVTLVDNGNGTATLAGTPALGTAATYALTLSATNAVGSPATQSFSLVVKQAPAITSGNTTTFTVGTSGSFSVTATGVPAATLSVTGTLPSGVTFTPGSGVLAGTPAAGTGGTYPLTFTANNGVTPNATQTFTLTVDQAPAITSGNNATFKVGVVGSFSVTTTGYPIVAISSTGSLPGGVTLTDNGNGTATLAGTPPAGSGGTYPLTLTATNGVGIAATQGFSLVVQQAPTITSATTTTFTVGTAGSFTVIASGTPASSFSAAGTLPSGVTLNAATGVLAGTPAAGTGGSYAITLTAANGVTPNATQSFTLIVNQAPAITSANTTSFTAGSAGAFTAVASGYPGASFSETGTLPGGVTLSAAGLLSGTPVVGSAGSYPITITANNGVGSPAMQTFTLVVLSPCSAISVSGALANGLYQTAYTNPAFNQTGGTLPITWTATGLPAGLSINSATGVVSGTPTTTVAAASVTITVSDVNSCPGSQALTGFKVAPVAGNNSYSTVGNTPLAVGNTPTTPYATGATTLFSNDSGPGTLTTTVGTFATTGSGSVTLAANGNFTYTPPIGVTGSTDTFSYIVTDGNGVTSAAASVTITLAGKVWYVDGSAGTNGNGAAATPFNTLASASTTHAAGDTIFVKSGGTATTTPGAISLKTSSTLWGQGTALPAIAGVTILNTAATSKPKLTGTVTLAGNTVTVSSLDINTSGAIGFTNTGITTGALVQNNVTVTSANAVAVNLTNAAGTFGFLSVSASGAANGILLNTLTAGTFNVSGSGSAGSGGTISGLTAPGAAISLTNTTIPTSFNYMALSSSGAQTLGVNASNALGLTVANSTFNSFGQYGIQVITTAASTSSGTFNIHDNTMNGVAFDDIHMEFKGSGTFTGHINTNTIGTAAVTGSGSSGGTALNFNNYGSGTVTAEINGNHVEQVVSDYGFEFFSANTTTAANHLNLTIVNNIVHMASAAAADAMTVVANQSNAFICVNIHTNTASSFGTTASNKYVFDAAGISLEDLNFNPVTFQVQGYSGAATNTGAVQTYLNTNDTLSGTAGGSVVDLGAAAGFTNVTCAIAP